MFHKTFVQIGVFDWLSGRQKGSIFVFLAHLSRRLIGELIVYKGIRRPSVRPSTFSNDISSETVRPILSILHT